MKRKPAILNKLKKFLYENDLYSEKDEMALTLLESYYIQFLEARDEVTEKGQTIKIIDRYKNEKIMTNPAFNNQMKLGIEIRKTITDLFAKKNVSSQDSNNPFQAMLKDVTGKYTWEK